MLRLLTPYRIRTRSVAVYLDLKGAQLIETGERQGRARRILFPPFHPEVLGHRELPAAEVFGRIKIMVWEGVNKVSGNTVKFSPVAIIASFSFMHAPLSKMSEDEDTAGVSC